MDPAKRSTQVHQSEGEDLGVLLYRSGRSLKNLSLSIGKGMDRFGNAILMTILFLMRNILWITLGTSIGLVYGIYVLNKNGTNYYSDMTVKANFNSARSLYNTIDYLNALISNGQTGELARIFRLTEDEAKRLRNFSAQYVESELITSDMYKEQFLNVGRTSIIRQDTFWVRTISYKDFKDALTTYDYPYHKISIVSTNPSLFGKLGNGIIDHVSSNSLLQEIRERQAGSNREEEQLIQSSIQKLDTLRQAYNQRLIRGTAGEVPGGNQLTILESSKQLKTPELDLYDKMLELVDELKRTRTRSVTEQAIIEIYSPLNPVGQKISFFQQSIARYTLIGFCISLLVLLLIAFYKFLLRFEKAIASKIRSGDISNIKS